MDTVEPNYHGDLRGFDDTFYTVGILSCCLLEV